MNIKSDDPERLLEVKQCPICDRGCFDILNIKDRGFWYRCSCGVIFQEEKPKHGIYNKEYREGYAEYKNSKFINIQAACEYCVLIENLTLGRKFLEVGYNLEHNINYYRERGWIAFGIDNNEISENDDRLIKGDFEDYNFEERKFDVIWMSHVFEHFSDPLKILDKCYNMLSQDGLLYISTPNIDVINEVGASRWPHWSKDEHYIMWNLTSLTRELEKRNFDVILKRENYKLHYTAWQDIHIIAQKR